MFEWLKKIVDRDYTSIERWKRDAELKQQFLVIIWNSYERRNRSFVIPPHTPNFLAYICEAIRGKDEYFVDNFDYREKKVASVSDIG